MKRLWAPWRMKYVEKQEKSGCVFCTVLGEQNDAENLIVFRGHHSFVILNRYPYTSGHLMVVANDHKASLELLEAPARAEMMELASKAIEVLRHAYRPEGFNLGANIGAAAGAAIAEHVHLHVVPRWIGDTNFMSSTAETRVLPEELDEAYRRVHSAWG